MTEKWNQIDGMPGVRVARIDGDEVDDRPDRPDNASGFQAASHSMLKLVIEPGSEVQPLGDLHAANLHMLDGALRVSISEGNASVNVASGEPIRAGDADVVYCDRGRKEMRIGDSAVLGTANNFELRDGVMHMEVVGEAPVEMQMSVVKKGSDAPDYDDGPVTMELCWVCPFT